ncbi:MAG: 4-hydroxy-3-methylbut-2-en-1-yl diphosphate synthase, partial [Bacteroidetes bacterium]|nr:4-hydroxy-3-methylbut-2-en-1-yl diphosphate synthase [Bacteroidota bacterium]
LGVSLGRGRAHLFKHGEVVGTVDEDEIVDAVLQAIEEWDEEADDAADAASDGASEATGDGSANVKKPELPT